MRKIIFIVLVFCFTVSRAQYTKPYFNTYSIVNGLPEGNVTASLQDKLGYMWFGTQNGLVRYDGYQLKQYPIPDDNGIPLIYCSIKLLHEDKEGKLWALVDKEGLYYFNRQTDAFYKAKTNKADVNLFRDYYFYDWAEDRLNHIHWLLGADFKNNYKPCLFAFDARNNSLRRYESEAKGKKFVPAYEDADIIKDASGKIWLATDSLVSYFDPGSGSFKPFFVVPDSTKKIMIADLMADPANKNLIWVSTYFSGVDQTKNPYKQKLYQVNTASGAYKVFMHNDKDPASLAGNRIRIFSDSLNRVWCATEKGISLFNPRSGNFTNYSLELPAPFAVDRLNIRTIAADQQGNLWLGGSFKGLFHLDPEKAVSAFYSHSNEPGSLPDLRVGVNKLFYDRSGTLWISMPFSGIARLDQRKTVFNPLVIEPPSVEMRGNKLQPDFRIVGKASDSIFYVRNASSLFAWNYKINSYSRIDFHNSKVHPQIRSVLHTREGLVWIATNGSGLYCYNPANKSALNFRNDPKDSASVSSNDINILKEDANGDLWIGTGDNGLCRYIKTSKTFFRYPFIENNGTIQANNKLDDGRVHSMFFDREGVLWVGTNLGGLNRLDTRTGKFTSFLDLKSGFNCVINIYEDKKGRLWAGTYLSGLFLFDRKTGNKKRYSEKDGLLYNSVNGISEDNAGNIWLASARGLSRFNPEKNSFTNFPGLEDDNLSLSILYKRTDGHIQVAVLNGLVSFDPGMMGGSKVPPSVLIESVKYIDENNKDSIVYTTGRDLVKLQYNENKISFQFTALHYANPELNQYAYRLDGYDKDWIQAGTQRAATYTSLSPGKYTFRVKAANSDGIWNEAGALFVIIILPPWWRTWWAYGIYLLMLLAGIRVVHRYQKNRTIRKEREKTQQKELEHAREIEKAYADLKETQIQLIQSEKMASLGELTAGIAHEIQNPLNFVNNFSEVNTELIDELEHEVDKGNLEEVKALAKDIKENEQKINHHGKRADNIVKSMLQHSRISNGVKEPTDINALADEYLRLAYHGLRAKDKSFNATLKTDFDETIGKIDIIPQDFGRVILNLITNAFYAVNEKRKLAGPDYKPTVSVISSKTNSKVELLITDNGNGIPQKIVEKIFQPFFTTKPAGEGTGLGLSLSYDIVKAHGGQLKVESEVDSVAGKPAFTTFTISLPLFNTY